jgi:hypothetical protein
VLLIYQLWLDEKFKIAICVSTITASLFRFELVLLFGPIFLPILLQRKVDLLKAIGLGLATLGITLCKLEFR